MLPSALPLSEPIPNFSISIAVHHAQKCHNTEYERDGREDHDDLIFAPAAKLKMVMDGRHLEDALTVRQLEIRHL